MKEGGKPAEAIAQRVSVKIEDAELLLRKAYRKLKQAKVTNEIFVRGED